MYRVAIYFIFGALLLLEVTAFYPPIYIKQCSQSDPELNQCIVDNGNKAIPFIIKGDKLNNVPNMLPLNLPEVVIRDDQVLRFVLRNVEVYGLENTRMSKANLDLEGDTYSYELTNPRLTIIGDYEMSGHILEAPVNGVGRANITLVNGIFTQSMKFVVDKRNYVTVLFPKVTYKTKRNIYQFANLLKGNDFRGYQTNVYLNNNWREVSKFFEPNVSKILSKSLLSIYNRIAFSSKLTEILTP